MLKIKGLTKSFGGLLAVNKVEFELKDKQIVGLIGPNGAGKTTVFNMITGSFPCDAGTVHFRDEDITGLKPEIVSLKGLGRTFQIVKPFTNLSVLKNVMVGAFAHTNNFRKAQKKAEEVLELVELTKFKDVPAHSLPIGLKKRLELARVLCTDPQLLCLDEVLGGLTNTEVSQMIKLIRDLNERGLTILMVEHVMSAVMSLCNHVVVLNNGQKLAEGTPKEITKNSKVIEAYLGEGYDAS